MKKQKIELVERVHKARARSMKLIDDQGFSTLALTPSKTGADLLEKPKLKTEIAIERYKKGDLTLWGAARAAGCALEEFKEILQSRGIVIKISSTKKESNARLKRLTGV